MTEKEKLYRGTSHAAWGYLFYYLDINLGSVSILPRFVGYLLFLWAIRYLRDQRRDLTLLRPLGLLLALFYGADWLASWLGTTIDGQFLVLDLVIGAASLYFHFQFLTDCAALAAAYQAPGDTLDRRLLRWRTMQTVLITVTAIILSINSTGPLGKAWDRAAFILTIVCLIASLCLTLCLMAALFALRRLFREDAENSQVV